MKVLHRLDLTDYNSYKLCSEVETAYFPESIEEVVDVVNREHPIVIGGGCNIIFSKEKYSTPFMFIRDNYSGIIKRDNNLQIKAGTGLKVLSEYALENELSGVEYYYDIPGCVGGATIMNAGCSGVSFSDLIKSVTFYNVEKGCIESLNRENLRFEYRGNVLKTMGVVVLDVELVLKDGVKSAIRELMQSNKANRWAKQPREYPSAGSVFKRPVGHYVGPMITDVGLKGFKRGGASISDKHAGFIVNQNNAKAEDILYLIKLAQERVYEKFGVLLELEQQII